MIDFQVFHDIRDSHLENLSYRKVHYHAIEHPETVYMPETSI